MAKYKKIDIDLEKSIAQHARSFEDFNYKKAALLVNYLTLIIISIQKLT
jgi:hypothetical protein